MRHSPRILSNNLEKEEREATLRILSIRSKQSGLVRHSYLHMQLCYARD